MTTYNTGNPIGSTDSRDRLDNTENMDYLENSTTELTHPDRLGTVRKTRHGMEAEHDAQIAAHESEHNAQMQAFESDFDGRLAGMAFTRVGSFTTGATLTDMRQVLVWEASQGGDGHEYGWAGSFPKVVAAASTPLTTGGIGAGAWVDRTDVTLRSELSANDGMKLIGCVSDITTLRTTEPTLQDQRILLLSYYAGSIKSGGGVFVYDSTDTTSIDDGGVIIVTASGKRWKRKDIEGGVNAEWFGVSPSAGDITSKLNAATQYCLKNKTKLSLPSGILQLDGNWLIDGDSFFCEGQGMENTVIYLHKNGDGIAGLTAKKTMWDANSTYPGPRIRNFVIKNIGFWGSIENVSGTQSSRTAMDLRGVGFDFEIGNIWFYNIGRNAIVAEDLWDGDIHNCKIHGIGKDVAFTSTYPQAIAFRRKLDSCNAIRLTNNHFEHCKRGAINIQDYCYSFFLTNNKFESINNDVAYPVEYPIYVGDNHRNFVMIGGFAVLNQQDKNVHFLRCFGDNTKILGVEFIGSNVTDGAAVLDLEYGNFNIGPVVSAHMDVDGGQIEYPIIVRSGRANFNGSTIKINNPGKCFYLGGSRSIANSVSITGVGTAQTSGCIFYQEDPLNNIGEAKFFGIVPLAGYVTNQASKYEVGDVIMAVNKSYTVSLANGDVIDSTAIRPSNALGVEDSSAILVGHWMCIGKAPAYVDGQASNSVSMFKRVS